MVRLESIADNFFTIINTKENVKAEYEALLVIAEKADGALRDALSVFDQMVNFCNRDITYDAVIKNLNILDHEYFFKMAKFFNDNNIHSSLLLFNEILLNGFDGQLFLNGLGNHMRNLLVCKDASTLSLLECSDAVKAKYKEQCALMKSMDIVDSLKIISDTDVNYKISKNQRLHVELALMKLASLNLSAEKKKSINLQ